MEDSVGTLIHEPPSSGPTELRRSAHRGQPSKRLQAPPSEPSVSKRKPGRPPVSSHPKKRQARNRRLYEWLVEEDDCDEVQTILEVDATATSSAGGDDESQWEPQPHIQIILSSLDLRVVLLQSRDQRGLPYRFIACTRCLKGLEPGDAVTHAAGAPSRGGHNVRIPQAQMQVLRKWIEDTADLCSAQNMPPLPNPHGPLILFIQTAKGYKCNSCSFCSTMKRVISYHTSTVPGHSTARKATLQHLFHNRLLFSVQPDRHNEGRGNADGVDLYSLYAKQYGLDDEDESAAFIPLCSDEKEMPMLLQITRWHDHVWRYLKNDGEDSDEDSSEDSMDEEDERNGDDRKANNKKGSDDDNNNNNNNPYKYRQTR